jgi:hypothetical protein
MRIVRLSLGGAEEGYLALGPKEKAEKRSCNLVLRNKQTNKKTYRRDVETVKSC